MPDLDPTIWYPSREERILDYYAGIYDCAFIALHPFLKSPNFSGRSPDADFAEKNFGDRTAWEKVRIDLGFKDLASVGRAVRILGGALREEFGDPTETKLLLEYCDANDLWLPEQDHFPAHLEPAFVKLLRDAGVAEVDVREEFEEALHPFEVQSLDGARPWSDIPGFPVFADRIIASDRSLLAIIEWDSTFTLIASKSERLDSVDLMSLFEGFPVTREMRMNWWKADGNSDV